MKIPELYSDTIITSPHIIRNQLDRCSLTDTSRLSKCVKVLHSKCKCTCDRFIGIYQNGSYITVNCKRIVIAKRILYPKPPTESVTTGDSYLIAISRTLGKTSTKLVMCLGCSKYTRISRFTEMK